MLEVCGFLQVTLYCWLIVFLRTDFTEDDAVFVQPNGELIATMSNISISVPEPGTLALYGMAPQSVYQSVIREVYYVNSADEPGATQRLVQLTIEDEMFASSAFTSVTIVPTNDPAFLNFTSRELTFNESARTPLYLFDRGNSILMDPDGMALQWLTISIVSPIDPNDTLVADVQGTELQQVVTNGGRMLNISGEGSLTDCQTVLSTVTYNNLFPGMNVTERSIEVSTFDGMTISFVHFIDIIVIPFDDQPMCFFDNTLVRM